VKKLKPIQPHEGIDYHTLEKLIGGTTAHEASLADRDEAISTGLPTRGAKSHRAQDAQGEQNVTNHKADQH